MKAEQQMFCPCVKGVELVLVIILRTPEILGGAPLLSPASARAVNYRRIETVKNVTSGPRPTTCQPVNLRMFPVRDSANNTLKTLYMMLPSTSS